MGMRIEDPHALLLELMRNNFGVFLRKAFPWIRGGDLLGWNWHLDAIVHQLDRVYAGDCRRLLVNLPPRNCKSIAISIAWVAWMLGRDPRHNFVCVSYSNDLSYNLARECLAIVQAPWYRELFPRTVLKRLAAHDFETTAGGGRLATSITGTLTGRGGDTIILDDVIKPQEAASEVVRATVNGWFQSTLSSRLNDKRIGAIICVMQRLHQYDLSGLLIESGRYDVLSLPAIATRDELIQLPRGLVHQRRVGDVLHPAREPRETLEEQRADMGSDQFAAQFQQDPVPAFGNIIKAAWFKTYDPAAVDRIGGVIVQSIDTANKGGPTSDFSVVITARVKGKYVYILDVARVRVEYPELLKKVIALGHEHRPNSLLIEEQGSGISLIADLRAMNDTGMPNSIAQKPTLDKLSRVEGITGMIEGGQLLLPSDAPWLSEFKAELLAFPNGRFDDQVDALTQLMGWVRQRQSYKTPSNVGPILAVQDEYGRTHWIGDLDDDMYASGSLPYELPPDFDPWEP